MQMKYVMFENDDFIVFPEEIFHIDAASLFPLELRAVSAGFCQVENGKLKCYGDSGTLQLTSRKNIDAAIMLKRWKLPPPRRYKAVYDKYPARLGDAHAVKTGIYTQC